MPSATTVVAATLFSARSPMSRPIADATHAIAAIDYLVVRLRLADGGEGDGHLLAFEFAPQALRGALRDALAFLLAGGYAAHESGRFRRDWDAHSEYLGREGLLRWAAGAIDAALWDAWGRHLGQPVWRLLGGDARPVPVYGSGGWLNLDDDALRDEVRDHLARGYRAVKIKVGAREPGRDTHRLRLVRDAVGPEVRIMMDANQGLTVPEALDLALAARPLGIRWFEEPIPRTDWDGYAALRRQAGIALAMGEREFDGTALRELAWRGALDLWQPDLLRLGGVQAWRDTAAQALAAGLPVLPHYYKEYDVPLLCTIPNGAGAESFAWVEPLIDRPLRVQDGCMLPHDAPGWGFRFRDALLTELR